MKLFPAKKPLADVAIDILGDLIRTPRGNRYLLVMCDRYSKVVRTVPLKTISALSVARAFVDHWVSAFGIPKTVLTDNGSQFSSKLMLETYRILGAKGLFTTTYHPQTNGQCERFNSTLLSTVRKHTEDHPKDWDLYTSMMTFAYNTQVHESTGVSPFELVLSRAPNAFQIEEPDPDIPMSKKETEARWLARLKLLTEKHRDELEKRQWRYQEAFNKRVRPRRPIKKDDYVFLRRDEPARKGESLHKLSPKALGPYKVTTAHNDGTVTIEREEILERVNLDRVEYALQGGNDPIANNQKNNNTNKVVKKKSKKLRSQQVFKDTSQASETQTSAESYGEGHVLERIDDHKIENGEHKYLVKWYGFNNDQRTWQRTSDLWNHQIRRYWRNEGTNPPESIREARDD